MTDIWAHCPGCDRWFYPESTAEAVQVSQEARCPVCARRPDQVEDRAAEEHDGEPVDTPEQAPVARPVRTAGSDDRDPFVHEDARAAV